MVVFAALALTACSQPTCTSLTPARAEAMAVHEKAGKLSKSTPAYAANFKSDKVIEVRTDAEGYAATIAFMGKDGWTLVALVKNDCSVGWSELPPHLAP